MGLEARIQSSRLGFRPRGWDLGGGGTKEEKKKKKEEKFLHM